jgi:sigma-E factor negative regulatory protein RseC
LNKNQTVYFCLPKSSKNMVDPSFSQTGTIESINGERAWVRIECRSACAACHAREGCLPSDTEDKLIEAPLNNRKFETGQLVTVTAQKSLAYQAVFWGYVLPFIIVITTLIIFLSLNFSESKAGIVSVLLLLPYYYVLYLLKDKFRKKFVFEIN